MAQCTLEIGFIRTRTYGNTTQIMRTYICAANLENVSLTYEFFFVYFMANPDLFVLRAEVLMKQFPVCWLRLGPQTVKCNNGNQFVKEFY
jgi:hypothetical protein